jgi:hypothetical protein
VLVVYSTEPGTPPANGVVVRKSGRRAATAYPSVNRALEIDVQFTPFVLRAIVVFESPTAVHCSPFHATLQQSKLNVWLGDSVQLDAS